MNADASHPTARAYGVLALSIVGISFAAPLIRLSSSGPLVVATWRLALSLALIAIPLSRSRGWEQWSRLSSRDRVLAAVAGACLAAHFWSWNASIGFTTVAASVTLVNLQPAFVAAGSVLFLHEPPSRRQIGGVLVAMAGAFVIGLSDLWLQGMGSGPRAVLGDALAVVGAVTAAAYYVIGRRLRQILDLWPYVALVYGACFIVLLVLSLLTRAVLLPQPSREWLIYLALAIGPMLLGHTGMNWALKYLPAFIVNLTVLGEPVGATMLAAVLPGIHEVPSATVLLGGALILGGIIIASRR